MLPNPGTTSLASVMSLERSAAREVPEAVGVVGVVGGVVVVVGAVVVGVGVVVVVVGVVTTGGCGVVSPDGAGAGVAGTLQAAVLAVIGAEASDRRPVTLRATTVMSYERPQASLVRVARLMTLDAADRWSR